MNSNEFFPFIIFIFYFRSPCTLNIIRNLNRFIKLLYWNEMCYMAGICIDWNEFFFHSQRGVVLLLKRTQFIFSLCHILSINRWLMIFDIYWYVKYECSSQDSTYTPRADQKKKIRFHFVLMVKKETRFTSKQIIDQKFHRVFLCCSHSKTVSCVTACHRL